MSGVSEAEVEAAALAIRAERLRLMPNRLETEEEYEARIARATLTAAAQVRAQEAAGAENRIASPAQEAQFASYVESVARALHEAHMPYCDYTYPFDDPMSSSDMYRELARAVTLVRAGGGVQ